MNSTTADYTLLPIPSDYVAINHSQILTSHEADGVDPYFKCCLCDKLVSPVNPLECSQCHIVFCESCIDDFITDRIRKASERMQQPTTASSGKKLGRDQIMICPQGCENLQVTCLHSFARGILNKTLLGCPMAGHQEGTGCQAKIRYEDYMQHVTHACGELKVQCKCGMQMK